ncbi:hypothetical protein F4859DRAFT_493777 [Xylaria cf. heliscus]|nr:hypothetical protein F4859DRAFT_493777 [Xylaria cf. heliscus]
MPGDNYTPQVTRSRYRNFILAMGSSFQLSSILDPRYLVLKRLDRPYPTPRTTSTLPSLDTYKDNARPSKARMLLFAILSGLLVWTVVLSVNILHNWRLLLRALRWSTTLYLAIFGLLAGEVLREGLVVNGSEVLHWDVRLAWTAWYALVVGSALDWRFLVPAAILPAWVLGYPEARALLDYGLVRLGWVDVVHSPLAWTTSPPETLGPETPVQTTVDRVPGVVTPISGPVKFFMDYVVGGVLWIIDRCLDKLWPPPGWT